MDPYVTESDRRRTDAVKYEDIGTNAALNAADMRAAGNLAGAAAAYARASTHYRMAAAARRDAAALPGGTGIDLHIAELLDRDARGYDEHAAALSAE
jgi:hypothetical protein